MNETIIFDVVLGVALTTGLVEVVKRATSVAKRFLPLISVGVGIGLSLLGIGLSLPSVLTGLVIGLTSSGLFSGIKATVGK